MTRETVHAIPSDGAHDPLSDPPLEKAIAQWVSRDTSTGEKLRSAALWGAGLSFMGSALGTMALVNTVLPSDRMEWLNRFYCRAQVALAGAKWRCVVHPDVDPSAAYMFCQNHTNHFDHVVLYDATPHFKQGLELEEHFKYPVYGTFMRNRGTIPVRRGSQGQTPEIMAHMLSLIHI